MFGRGRVCTVALCSPWAWRTTDILGGIGEDVWRKMRLEVLNVSCAVAIVGERKRERGEDNESALYRFGICKQVNLEVVL